MQPLSKDETTQLQLHVLHLFISSKCSTIHVFTSLFSNCLSLERFNVQLGNMILPKQADLEIENASLEIENRFLVGIQDLYAKLVPRDAG